MTDCCWCFFYFRREASESEYYAKFYIAHKYVAKDDLEDSKTCVKILKNTYERCSVPLNVCDSHTQCSYWTMI